MQSECQAARFFGTKLQVASWRQDKRAVAAVASSAWIVRSVARMEQFAHIKMPVDFSRQPLAARRAASRIQALTVRTLLAATHSLMPAIRKLLLVLLGHAIWLAGEQPAQAQMLLAQSGTAKTAVGWVLVAVALFFALLVVGLPSWRKLPEGDAKPAPQKKR